MNDRSKLLSLTVCSLVFSFVFSFVFCCLATSSATWFAHEATAAAPTVAMPRQDERAELRRQLTVLRDEIQSNETKWRGLRAELDRMMSNSNGQLNRIGRDKALRIEQEADELRHTLDDQIDKYKSMLADVERMDRASGTKPNGAAPRSGGQSGGNQPRGDSDSTGSNLGGVTGKLGGVGGKPLGPVGSGFAGSGAAQSQPADAESPWSPALKDLVSSLLPSVNLLDPIGGCGSTQVTTVTSKMVERFGKLVEENEASSTTGMLRPDGSGELRVSYALADQLAGVTHSSGAVSDGFEVVEEGPLENGMVQLRTKRRAIGWMRRVDSSNNETVTIDVYTLAGVVVGKVELSMEDATVENPTGARKRISRPTLAVYTGITPSFGELAARHVCRQEFVYDEAGRVKQTTISIPEARRLNVRADSDVFSPAERARYAKVLQDADPPTWKYRYDTRGRLLELSEQRNIEADEGGQSGERIVEQSKYTFEEWDSQGRWVLGQAELIVEPGRRIVERLRRNFDPVTPSTRALPNYFLATPLESLELPPQVAPNKSSATAPPETEPELVNAEPDPVEEVTKQDLDQAKRAADQAERAADQAELAADAAELRADRWKHLADVVEERNNQTREWSKKAERAIEEGWSEDFTESDFLAGVEDSNKISLAWWTGFMVGLIVGAVLTTLAAISFAKLPKRA